MKPKFSPWKPYLAAIALFGAIVAYDMFEKTSFHGVEYLWQANGVVRSLRGADPVMATIAMDDGSVVEAPVATGCFVQIGDHVLVNIIGGAKLVFPEYMGARR
jgi:hypothetical protein